MHDLLSGDMEYGVKLKWVLSKNSAKRRGTCSSFFVINLTGLLINLTRLPLTANCTSMCWTLAVRT